MREPGELRRLTPCHVAFVMPSRGRTKRGYDETTRDRMHATRGRKCVRSPAVAQNKQLTPWKESQSSMTTTLPSPMTENTKSRRRSRRRLVRASTSLQEEVFRILDRLKPTATGLDGIPAWYLRLGAAVFAAPIADLFNKSMSAGVVPKQWKKAIIMPVPKVAKAAQPIDYRPISITAVLSLAFQRHIVRKHIYRALQEPPEGLDFNDQFGFRPTG